MTKNIHRSSLAVTGSLTLLLAITFVLRAGSASAVDCVGKPYGYSGCPTRPAQSSAVSSGGITSCGNAIVDTGEDCDKGRFNGKTECGTDCKFLYCGDGIITRDAGEECEPQSEEVYVEDKNGNLTTEIRFTGTSTCGWFCQPPVCNDSGKCTGGCKMKYVDDCAASGSTLAPAAPEKPVPPVTQKSFVAPVCGNGTIERDEECDDGNRNPVDECGNDCMLPVCGDGTVQKGEECDDGNDEFADGCTSDCMLPVCGDGIVQLKEQCDDADDNSDTIPDACRTTCMAPRCGDGVTDKGEQCDADGGNSDTAPNGCRTTCRLASCGDGVKDANEECDDGNKSDTDTCTITCKRPACGDGIVQAGEECDWGTKNSDTAGNACRSSCKLPRCGDMVTDTGEQCDGGQNCTKECKTQAAASSRPATAGTSVKKLAGKSSSAPKVAAVTKPSSDSGMISILLLAAGGIGLLVAVYLLRRKITGLFSGSKKSKDLDDIPLDQIEMPWHKW